MAKNFSEWQRTHKGKFELLDDIASRTGQYQLVKLVTDLCRDAFDKGYAACDMHHEETAEAEEEEYAYANIKQRLADEFDLPEYDNSNYQQFCSDVLRLIDEGDTDTDTIICTSDELPDFRHYKGRFYYEGPAVVVNNVSDFMRHCTVRCQHDSMGLDYIVYPR